MRAAVIHELKGSPRVEEFAEPVVAESVSKVRVIAGGIGPTDLMRAAGIYGSVSPPYVVGGEGVGRLENGTRVYFGHPVSPHGSWADVTSVPNDEIWPLPDDVSDGLAIALGISGTGALIPLEEAQIQPGERVLILGATGPLGQIALQLARALGAGVVVGAARTAASLARLRTLGIADETVQLGAGEDFEALKSAAGKGYDVVLDVVYGPPAEAAMRATAPGARMMSIGVQAGPTVTLSLRDLVFRKHIGVGTGQRPAAERRAAYERLLRFGRDHQIKVDVTSYPLDAAATAWDAQRGSPHSKLIVSTGY
jgi:NADPH:quinone reductase